MLNLFSGLEFHTALMLGLALAFVLFYEAINGFHDTANAIATVIYTRALRENYAVIMAGICNFLGVVLGGLSVAYAIVHLLPTDLLLNVGSIQGLALVFSILLAAIFWNLGTWYLGLPASSSHTLIGAIIGVALTNAYVQGTSIVEALNISKMVQIFLSLILSPIVGLVMSGIMIWFLGRMFTKRKKSTKIHLTPAEREKRDGKRKPPFWTRIMLILSAVGVSFSHGANDGQKGIGLLMLVLISVAPAGFIVNMNTSQYDLNMTKDAFVHLQDYYKTHQKDLSRVISMHAPQAAFNPETKEYHCDASDALVTLRHAQELFSGVETYHDLNPTERAAARRLLLCVADTTTEVAKLPDTSVSNANYLNKLRKDVLATVEYAPLWIIVSVALALAPCGYHNW